MEEILEGLTQTSGVQASMIVTKDGLVVAHSGDVGALDADSLGASSSEFFATAESMLGERLAQGPVEIIHVESSHGKFVMSGINESSFLLVIARSKVNLGLIRWEVKAAAERLKEVV
ncbi:MAG TPA: roadblock/LC7 domain-containing protein [Candidatus Xenobia bacterium]